MASHDTLASNKRKDERQGTKLNKLSMETIIYKKNKTIKSEKRNLLTEDFHKHTFTQALLVDGVTPIQESVRRSKLDSATQEGGEEERWDNISLCRLGDGEERDRERVTMVCR